VGGEERDEPATVPATKSSAGEIGAGATSSVELEAEVMRSGGEQEGSRREVSRSSLDHHQLTLGYHSRDHKTHLTLPCPLRLAHSPRYKFCFACRFRLQIIQFQHLLLDIRSPL